MKVFLDAETTHLQPGQIAQLSYIVTDDDLNILKAKNFYFSVETMSRGASEVNGLNKRKLATLSGGKDFPNHILEIKNDIKNYDLICHNNDFDYEFMQEEFSRRRQRYRPKVRFCTMKHFTNICRLPGGPRGQYKWPRLTEVMRHLGIKRNEVAKKAAQVFRSEPPKVHDSRFDVMAVYLAYQKAFTKSKIEITNESEAIGMLAATLNEIMATKQSGKQPKEQTTAVELKKRRRVGCFVIIIILWLLSIRAR